MDNLLYLLLIILTIVSPTNFIFMFSYYISYISCLWLSLSLSRASAFVGVWSLQFYLKCQANFLCHNFKINSIFFLHFKLCFQKIGYYLHMEASCCPSATGASDLWFCARKKYWQIYPIHLSPRSMLIKPLVQKAIQYQNSHSQRMLWNTIIQKAMQYQKSVDKETEVHYNPSSLTIASSRSNSERLRKL